MVVKGGDDDVYVRARSLLDEGRELPPEIPSVIRYSWMRSRLAGVPQDRLEVPFREPAGVGERLQRAADLVLGRFAEQLGGTQVAIVLADREARVVGRWAGERAPLRRLSQVSVEEGFLLAEDYVGTNGLGTALETLAPVAIRGREHYTEQLQRFLCVGVPIRNPLTRRVEGVLNVSCLAGEGNDMLMPTVLDLGTQVEQELAAQSSLADRAVFEEFLTRSRMTSAPLVALGGQFMLTNSGAASLLQPSDQALLWDQASESFTEETTVVRTFQLGSGEVRRVRCTPVRSANRAVGALVEVESTDKAPRPSVRSLRIEPRFRSPAWVELERRLSSFTLRAGDRLRLVGEDGTGKATLAGHIHRRQNTADIGDPTVLRCRGSEPEPELFDQVERRLRDPHGTIVICGVHRLTAAGIERLLGLLDDAQQPPVLITTSAADDGGGYRALEHRFGHQLLNVPPLRERRDDLPDLVYDIVSRQGRPVHRVTRSAMAALLSYEWPGNLSQLVATLTEAATVSGTDLDLPHLPEHIRSRGMGRRRLSRIEELERDAIVASLRENNGNKIRTAADLGMSRSTLYRRMRRYGLDTDRSLL